MSLKIGDWVAVMKHIDGEPYQRHSTSQIVEVTEKAVIVTGFYDVFTKNQNGIYQNETYLLRPALPIEIDRAILSSVDWDLVNDISVIKAVQALPWCFRRPHVRTETR